MQPLEATCINSNSWAEIDLDALTHNVSLLNMLGPKLMAVLKADAYGHRTKIVAPALVELGVTHFGIATVCEGAELRRLIGRAKADIYVMTSITPSESDAVVEYGLIPFVSSLEALDNLQKAAVAQGKTVSVHLEVDTGIGRAGLQPAELLEVLNHARQMEHIAVTGICTHFTSGEDRSDAESQHALFELVLREIPPELLGTLIIHAANSPALLNVPGARYGMFRPGLLLYGIEPVPARFSSPGQAFPYRPVLSLYSRVILVRDVPANTPISYGRTYTTSKRTRLATLGIGYGDGYPRRLSNIGQVLLAGGISAPIRGRVCMDQICVEVPEGATVREGDQVTLIGRSGDAEIRAVDIAEMIDATPHEITTCLTDRVGRVIRLTPLSGASETLTGSPPGG